MKKTKQEEQDFVDYLFVAFLIQLLAVWHNYEFDSFLVDLLVVIDTTSLVLAGFSLYYYLFKKDKLALKSIPIMIGLSIVVYTISYAYVSNPTLWGFLSGWIRSIPAIFISGIIIYGITILLFWLYQQGKKLLN